MKKPLPYFVYLAVFGVCCVLPRAQAQILIDSSAENWTPIQYPGQHPDFFMDEQATSPESDLVGDAGHPAFYKAFWDGGTGDPTDGEIGFRFRMAGSKGTTFDAVGWVGVDMNGDGALDFFIGALRNGSNSHLGIFKAGTGLNTSPSTTDISSAAFYQVPISATNYSWQPVTAANDPGATNFNLDGGSGGSVNHNDHFLSMKLPFSQVVAAVASFGLGAIDENTPLHFVAATATQSNSLNQDLNGVNGGLSSSITWQELNAFSQTYSATSISHVPEPTSFIYCLSAVGVMLLRCRRSIRGRFQPSRCG